MTHRWLPVLGLPASVGGAEGGLLSPLPAELGCDPFLMDCVAHSASPKFLEKQGFSTVLVFPVGVVGVRCFPGSRMLGSSHFQPDDRQV